MASNSYIRVVYNAGGSSEEGRKLFVNIEPLERSKGIPTADIPIPTLSPDSRILIPTGGNQDDFTLNCVLLEEDSQVAVNVSSTGFETDRTDVRSIKEQWDFLFDEIMEVPGDGGIFSKYILYTDWNEKTYEGWCQVVGSINNEDYTGEVPIRLVFKRGKNPLSFLT